MEKQKMKRLTILACVLAWLPASVYADTSEARCDVYPAGEDHTDVVIPCSFSQRQGFISIRRSDGVVHELSPVGKVPGNFLDQNGYRVFRQSGLGDRGLIFRFPDESVYVYWDSDIFKQIDESNPTWPFSTQDYDATTLLRCYADGASEPGQCPAGILRMEGAQASIVVLSPQREKFTINFMTDYINATNRKAEGELKDDTWIVTIDGEEVYEVPLAAIEGG
jgi:hypothetical protein